MPIIIDEIEAQVTAPETASEGAGSAPGGAEEWLYLAEERKERLTVD